MNMKTLQVPSRALAWLAAFCSAVSILGCSNEQTAQPPGASSPVDARGQAMPRFKMRLAGDGRTMPSPEAMPSSR